MALGAKDPILAVDLVSCFNPYKDTSMIGQGFIYTVEIIGLNGLKARFIQNPEHNIEQFDWVCYD